MFAVRTVACGGLYEIRKKFRAGQEITQRPPPTWGGGEGEGEGEGGEGGGGGGGAERLFDFFRA
jgi:hypothetical protein